MKERKRQIDNAMEVYRLTPSKLAAKIMSDESLTASELGAEWFYCIQARARGLFVKKDGDDTGLSCKNYEELAVLKVMQSVHVTKKFLKEYLSPLEV